MSWLLRTRGSVASINRSHGGGNRKLRVELLEERRVLATFTVSDLADAGPNTLREAVDLANQMPGHDTIDFATALSGLTINLSTDELHITDSVTVDGSGLSVPITIDASSADTTPGVPDGNGIRIFNVDDGLYTSTDATISHLTLTGGDVTGSGGAIFSAENLAVLDCEIIDNSATQSGGGILAGYNSGFEIARTTVSGNQAGRGGGVSASYYGISSNTGVISDSIISGNQATFSGGGFSGSFQGGFTLTITDSELSGNASGGISLSVGYGTTATIRSSTISNNTGSSGARMYTAINSRIDVEGCVISGNSGTVGGGFNLDTNEGLIVIRDSSISGNTASSRGGGVVAGGIEYGSIQFFDSTIRGNSTPGNGGGVYGYVAGGTTVNFNRTTIADNDAATGGGVNFQFSTFGLYSGNAKIVDSTISGNSADMGGGVYVNVMQNYGGLRLNNSTVSGNESTGSGGGIAASIYSGSASIDVKSSTIAGNIADSDLSGGPSETGGGILMMGNGKFLLSNSIVADNVLGLAADDASGNTQATFSLFESNNPGQVQGSNNLFGVYPLLLPLTNNGGPTNTMALDDLSPAIDAGNPASMPGTADVLPFDQRGSGYDRVVNSIIDLGAFEAGNLPDGDFNDDWLYDCMDIDALVAEIASGANNPLFDLNADAVVDLLDRDLWLAEAGEANLGPGKVFSLGDANLDGSVDVSDFNIWNQFKFTSTAAWCSGDFDANGVVDVSDFNLWNQYKFTSADQAAFQSPSEDPAEREVRRSTLPSWFTFNELDEQLR